VTTSSLERPVRSGAHPRLPERSPRRRWHVLAALTRSDLRMRHGRGRSQIVKWLVEPFALVGVYLLLRIILNRGGEATGLTLACSVVPFQIVMLSCVSAMTAISNREPILLNMRFDRLLIPPAAVLTEGVAFAASFLLFPITMLVYGVGPTAALLWLPVVVAVTFVLALGAAWPAALLGLWVPSVRQFAAQVLRIGYFAAPGLVALAETSDRVREWIVFNPLTGLFEGYRDVFLYGQSPAFWELAYPAGVGVALALAFVPVYRREERHFAKLVGE
jgi:ABC-type polysaccharide/polyol phosphate export permease